MPPEARSLRPEAWPGVGPRQRPGVWAPSASTVEIVLPSGAGTDDTAPMTPCDDGWWAAPRELPAGTDYAFRVDRADPRPDPRSAWQPYGVHGPSRVFDPSAHLWSDSGWTGRDVRGCVVYELHVGTFTPHGTLDSAIERLDHLVGLGVDMVELMPVAAFPGEHGWGYDGVALYAVHEPYGGPAALQRFVDAAHGHGLAVCLDVVHNHLGPSGNYLSVYGPYFTDRHHTPWGEAVDLDGPTSAQVRRFIIDNAVRWLRDFHLDALRLDAVHALVDDSPRHLLAELADEVDALFQELGRPLSLVAESDLNDVAMITPTSSGGLGMTAQWADDVHHAIHALLTGERQGYYVDFGSGRVLAKALTEGFVHTGGWSTFRDRAWGAPVPRGTDGHRFVTFLSNHDQVGNRALGDRPSARLDPGTLAIGAALVLTSATTPMIFMGEEWGARTPWLFFTDHAEPELVAAIREGRAAEFAGHGWRDLYGHDVEIPDPQSSATVAASRLDWSEPVGGDHARLLDWYRTLVSLRRTVPDLASGDLDAVRVEHADDDSWLVVHRGAVRVVANLSPTTLRVPLTPTPEGRVEVLATWAPVSRPDGPTLTLPARTVTLLRTPPP